MGEQKGEVRENDDVVSVHDHGEGDDVVRVKSQSSFISTSRVYSEPALESLSIGKEHDSALESESNSKFDVKSSDVIASTRSTSTKSDISTEVVLVHDKGSFQMDGRNIERNHLNGAEDSFHAIGHDPKNTESSSSNCLPAILPLSLSNNGSHETSKKASNHRSHEPVPASSESGVSDCIAHRAVTNARTMNSMEISLMVGNHRPSLEKNCDALRQDDEIYYEEEHSHDGLGEVLEQTDASIHVSGIASYTEGQPPLTNGERTLSSEVSGGNEDLLVVKGNPHVDVGSRATDKIESPESSMTISIVGGFDLNEDINANGPDKFVQPAVSAISSHCVIHVVARAGVPSGLPKVPLTFEGEMGWKGSAVTSAFRPAPLSKHLDTRTHSRCNRLNESQGFTGIDLNVVAVEDNLDKGLAMENEGIPTASTSINSRSKNGSKHMSDLNIDLNCSYDARKEFVPSFESENLPLLDLNLSANGSVEDTYDNVHWLVKGQKSQGNTTLDLLVNSGKQDCYFTSRGNSAALSNTQHVKNHAHARQYLMAMTNVPQSVEMMQRSVPIHLQPKFPNTTPALSAQNYPYQGPDRPPSAIHYSGILPYMIYSHEHGIPLNPDRMNSFGAPHLVPVLYGHSTSNFATSTPKLDIKPDGHLSMSSSMVDEARQSFFHAEKSPMEEHVKALHQEAWYEASMKRKEPEAGFEYYQLGYRQVT